MAWPKNLQIKNTFYIFDVFQIDNLLRIVIQKKIRVFETFIKVLRSKRKSSKRKWKDRFSYKIKIVTFRRKFVAFIRVFDSSGNLECQERIYKDVKFKKHFRRILKESSGMVIKVCVIGSTVAKKNSKQLHISVDTHEMSSLQKKLII